MSRGNKRGFLSEFFLLPASPFSASSVRSENKIHMIPTFFPTFKDNKVKVNEL